MTRQTYGQYLTSVRLAVFDLTDGAIDLDDLPDAFDLGEAYEDGITPRAAASQILDGEGFFDFSFDSPEDLFVGYDCDGRPIGG